MVVISSIIAMLSMITIPSILRARQNAQANATKAELRTAFTGISMYYLEKSMYPKTWEDLKLYLPIDKFKYKYILNPNL